MRISTNMIYDKGVASIQRQSADLLHTQQQVSTGRRIVSPADDPISAARVLEVSQSKAVNAQFTNNQGYANDSLNLLENKLVGVGDVLQYVRERAVQAGNGTMTEHDLRLIATDIRSQYNEMLGLANSRDASGEYIFSGYRAEVQPYQGDLSGITYNGDQGERTMQVSSSRYMPTSVPGTQVFDNTMSASDAIFSYVGTNNTSATAPLAASFITTPVDPANLGHRYQISYDAAAGSYTVTDILPGTNATQNVGTFTPSGSPATISFNGLDVAVPATAPADGESFEVFVASKNVMDNMALFVSAMENQGASGMTGAVAFALTTMDAGLDKVLTTRATVGSQLTELETLSNVGGDLDVQYAATMSRLQDVDYAEALSNLTQQQTYLQAAQQSFTRISKLSLFNFLS